MKIKKVMLLLVTMAMLSGEAKVYATTDDTVFAESEKNSNSVIQKKGLIKNKKGKYFFFYKGERLRNRWKTINGKRYYFGASGSAAIGSKTINEIRYIFNEEGELVRTGEMKLVKVGTEYYLADKKGRAVTGWQMYNGKLYYSNSKGRIVRDTVKDGITLRKKGKALKSIETDIKIKTMSVVASITNEDMTKAEKLYACWEYITSNKFQYVSIYPDLTQAGWQKSLALQMLNTYGGNCYGYACAFAALAEEVGYEAYIVCGRVPGSRDGAADGYTRHAWVMIDGLYYDPQAHARGWASGIYGYTQYILGIVQQTVAF